MTRRDTPDRTRKRTLECSSRARFGVLRESRRGTTRDVQPRLALTWPVSTRRAVQRNHRHTKLYLALCPRPRPGPLLRRRVDHVVPLCAGHPALLGVSLLSAFGLRTRRNPSPGCGPAFRIANHGTRQMPRSTTCGRCAALSTGGRPLLCMGEPTAEAACMRTYRQRHDPSHWLETDQGPRTVGTWLRDGCRPKRAPIWPDGANRTRPLSCFCVGPSMLLGDGFGCIRGWPRVARPISSCLVEASPSSWTAASGMAVRDTVVRRRGPVRTPSGGQTRCVGTRSATYGRPRLRSSRVGECCGSGSARFGRTPRLSPGASSRPPEAGRLGLSVLTDGVIISKDCRVVAPVASALGSVWSRRPPSS